MNKYLIILVSSTIQILDCSLQYLKDTINDGFADTDWKSCLLDRTSYNGFTFIFNSTANHGITKTKYWYPQYNLGRIYYLIREG